MKMPNANLGRNFDEYTMSFSTDDSKVIAKWVITYHHAPVQVLSNLKEVSLSIIFEASMSAIILAFFKILIGISLSKELGPALEMKKKLEIITFTDKTTSEHNYILIE